MVGRSTEYGIRNTEYVKRNAYCVLRLRVPFFGGVGMRAGCGVWAVPSRRARCSGRSGRRRRPAPRRRGRPARPESPRPAPRPSPRRCRNRPGRGEGREARPAPPPPAVPRTSPPVRPGRRGGGGPAATGSARPAASSGPRPVPASSGGRGARPPVGGWRPDVPGVGQPGSPRPDGGQGRPRACRPAPSEAGAPRRRAGSPGLPAAGEG